ncbi:hypothetical protein MesoLj131a_62370 [Mesorhizobium sp. 131-2-1]|nr:hypothetical protein MesoLj131a_62370 [Mesorhizobium sp. 131-2-1]BCH04444.1 hypothetical protein MesoLj131b_64430 [Mesorhizobium sp. 131-2-5]
MAVEIGGFFAFYIGHRQPQMGPSRQLDLDPAKLVFIDETASLHKDGPPAWESAARRALPGRRAAWPCVDAPGGARRIFGKGYCA